MSSALSTGDNALRKRLDEGIVLHATVAQLAKDLDVADLRTPPTGAEAFEAVRAQVLAALEDMRAGAGTGLSRAVNRVDLTEVQVNGALERGGLTELAGLMVLRCLQKVLIREHYAGRA